MSALILPLGPVMIDITGLTLSEMDEEKLCHRLVGGIILFSRNYRDTTQLRALCDSIHALRTPLLLPAIAIKHHDSGQPYFELDANAAQLLDKLHTVHLSISDEREFALAFVILEKQ